MLLKSHQEARARGMSFVLKVKVMELILKSMLSKTLVHAKDPGIIRSKDFWILEIFFSYWVFVLPVSSVFQLQRAEATFGEQ